MGLLKEATPERSDPSVQCSPDLFRRGEAEMRLPRSSQSDGCAHFCLCTRLLPAVWTVYCILTSLSLRPQGHLWSQCFLPHTSVCAHVSYIISDFHPVRWGLHLLSQVPNCSVSLSAGITSTPCLFGWLLWDALQIPGLSPTVPTARAAPSSSVKVSVESRFCRVSSSSPWAR